jgi:hypothetical protein
MSRQEVRDYWSNKKYASTMILAATNDYAAARCCIVNRLFPGFTLASQAIEKLLKALIFLSGGEEMDTCHDPFRLKEKLKGLKDYELDKYDDVFKKLYDHFQSRYPDNKTTGKGASSGELPEIDALWLELSERLPVPDEAKFRLAFFTELLDPNPYWRTDYWLKIENKALEPKMDSMKQRYEEIKMHLYPD